MASRDAPPSPTLSDVSVSSRRSVASSTTRGPPPQKPAKPVHLTLRSSTSPYPHRAPTATLSPTPTGSADISAFLSTSTSTSTSSGGGGFAAHAHWDSQATIRGAHAPAPPPPPPPASGSLSHAPSPPSAVSTLRPMHTGVSAAESFFSSYTSSVHSREPSLLMPDETGMGSAGFAMASSPSGFLHQHNAHAIATSTAQARAAAASAAAPAPAAPAVGDNLNTSTITGKQLPRPFQSAAPANTAAANGEQDDDSDDDIEDIDSFLGDDTPQQAVASPRRTTASFTSPPQTADAAAPPPPPPAFAQVSQSPQQQQQQRPLSPSTGQPRHIAATSAKPPNEAIGLANIFRDSLQVKGTAPIEPDVAPAAPIPTPPPPPALPQATMSSAQPAGAHVDSDNAEDKEAPNSAHQDTVQAPSPPPLAKFLPAQATRQDADQSWEMPGAETASAESHVKETMHLQEPISEAQSATVKAAPIPRGLPARALFAFQGEPNSNELSLAAGQAFEVLDPHLAVGWSLAVIRAQDPSEQDRRGLVPNGWYCFIQDFQMAPPSAAGAELPPAQVQTSPVAPVNTTAPAQLPALANPLANLFRISRASMAAGMAHSTPIVNHAIPEENEAEVHDARGDARAREEAETAPDSNEDDRFQAWLKGTAANQGYLNPDACKSSPFLPNVDRFSSDHRRSSSTSSPGESMQGTLKAASAQIAAPPIPNAVTMTPGPSATSNTSKSGRISDSSASPVIVPSASAIEVRPALLAEPLSASTSALATGPTNQVAGSSKPGYLASLLSFGGKSFNRYGPFVTSGAEDWILCTEAGAGIEAPNAANLSFDRDTDEGDTDEANNSATWGRGTQRSVPDLSSLTLSSLSRSARRSKGEITQHMVISGPAGPRWKARSPPFHVQVHSPIKKKKLNGMHEYTLYTVTSTYPPLELSRRPSRRRRSGSGSQGDGNNSGLGHEADPEMEYAMPYDPTVAPEPAGHTLTVLRRFTHFAWLSRVLSTRYPALVLPALPSKQYAGRFSSEFIETRRADLDLWLSRVVRHPVARYEEALIFFLSEDDEAEWKRREAEFELPPKVEIVSGIGPTGAYSTVGRKGVPLSLAANKTGPAGSKAAAAAGGSGPGAIKSVVTLEGASTFFASTFHPDFNVDVGDAAAEARAMERFAEAYERAMLLEPGGGLTGGLSAAGGSSSGGGGRNAPGGGGHTVGASASAIAESAGPHAVPPRGYPAAGAVGVLPAWRGLRETHALSANSYRDLSFALLRLITGRGLGLHDDQAPPPPTSGAAMGGGSGSAGLKGKPEHWLHGAPVGGLGKRSATGASNEEGGWCWREGCTECVALTKSLQYMAQSLQHVADEYEDHTRMALMRQHERLKAIGRPRLSVDKLLEVHHATTAKYREATGEAVEDADLSASATSGARPVPLSTLSQTERELMAARCETVLNVTMSEMDRIHQERTEDWTAWSKHWLDDEIAHHERCLETLRNARAAFEPDSWEYYAREGPVLPTSYDAELYSTRRSAFPIPMPSAPYAPPGMTATALRPVSLATEVVREGVTKFTYLFGSSSGSGSGSAAGSPAGGGNAATPSSPLDGGYLGAGDVRRDAKGSPHLGAGSPAGVGGAPSSPYYYDQQSTRLGAGMGYGRNGSTEAGIATSPSAAAWPGAENLMTLRSAGQQQQQQQQQQAWYQSPPQDTYGKAGGAGGRGGAFHPNGVMAPPPPPPPPPPAAASKAARPAPQHRHRGEAPPIPSASSIFTPWR